MTPVPRSSRALPARWARPATHLAILLPSLAALLLLARSPRRPTRPATGALAPYRQRRARRAVDRAVGANAGRPRTRGVQRRRAPSRSTSRACAPNGEATDLVGRALRRRQHHAGPRPAARVPRCDGLPASDYGKFGGDAGRLPRRRPGLLEHRRGVASTASAKRGSRSSSCATSCGSKAGRIDANTEFAALHASEEFLNSSMGYSPTIWGMPTYPLPGQRRARRDSPQLEHVHVQRRRLRTDRAHGDAAGARWLDVARPDEVELGRGRATRRRRCRSAPGTTPAASNSLDGSERDAGDRALRHARADRLARTGTRGRRRDQPARAPVPAVRPGESCRQRGGVARRRRHGVQCAASLASQRHGGVRRVAGRALRVRSRGTGCTANCWRGRSTSSS